jgi:5-methylcytosine-specific restriction endonuclease McrA
MEILVSNVRIVRFEGVWMDDFLQSIVDAVQHSIEREPIPEIVRTCFEKRRANTLKQNKVYRKRHPDRVRLRRRLQTMRRRAVGEVHSKDVALMMKTQKGLCWWCGESLGDTYEIDHIIPVSRGGTNVPNNLVLAHERCNRKKFNKMPWEFNGRLF